MALKIKRDADLKVKSQSRATGRQQRRETIKRAPIIK